MEHYKSRTNDFFHFSNPQDDHSDLEDDDYDEHQDCDYLDDDDRSCDFSFRTSPPVGVVQSQPSKSQGEGLMKGNDNLSSPCEELGTFDNGLLISEIDSKMRDLSGKLLYTIEGFGTRLSKLEDKTGQLNKYVENVKDSAESYHGITSGKLRRIHDILQEVHDGVQYLRDKHEIAETQIQLAKLQGSKRDLRSAAQTNSLEQLPLSTSQPSCNISYRAQIPNQLLPNEAPFSHTVSCRPASGAPEIMVQEYLIPPPQPSQPLHQPQGAPQLPFFAPSPQVHSLQGEFSPQNHPFLSQHCEETPYGQSYCYPSSIQLSTSQQAEWGPTHELGMGVTKLTQVEPKRNYKSEFLAKYLPDAASLTKIGHRAEQPLSHDSSDVKAAQFYQTPSIDSSRSKYEQLPVAQILPHALPTATFVDDASNSGENRNTDDIVEKVTAMGFRRDLVKATVKKLTQNVSSLDLNMVVDRMINDG